MWTYYLFFLTIILFILIDSRVKTKIYFFEKIGILIPIIFGFVRYKFGNDYETYKAIHEIINGNGLNLEESYFRQAIRMEYGFKMLNLYIENFQIMIGLITLFNIVLIYRTIKYFSEKKVYLSIILYICIFQLYFYNLSAIRQSIASALFFYSSRYIVEKKIYKFILFILLGSLFHKSLILLLPFYFINKIEIPKTKIKKIIILLFIVGSILYIKLSKSLTLMILLLKSLGFLRFVYELEKVPEKLGLLTIIVFIGNIIYLGIILFLYPSKTKKDKVIYKLMVVAVTFSLLKILKISAFHRLENYFMFFEIIAIPKLISEFFNRKKILIFSVVLIYLILFNVRMLKENKESENYKSMKTIFYINERE